MLDFDNLDNLDQVKQSIGSDKYVYSCWTSPSGNGLKALVRVTNPERHRDHFRSLTSYFEKQLKAQEKEMKDKEVKQKKKKVA